MGRTEGSEAVNAGWNPNSVTARTGGQIVDCSGLFSLSIE